MGNSQVQLTNDLFDDLHPKYIPNSEKIIFSSNRENVSRSKPNNPNTNTFDLFTIDRKSQNLKQITKTPNYNEIQPQPINSTNYHYLSDKNGIYNQMFQNVVDSTISYIDTIVHYRYIDIVQQLSNYSRNAVEVSMFPKSSKYSLLYKINGKYNFYLGDSENFQYMRTNLKTHTLKKAKNIPTNIEGNSKLETENKINIFNYQFESEKRDKSSKNTTQSPQNQKILNLFCQLKKYIMLILVLGNLSCN